RHNDVDRRPVASQLHAARDYEAVSQVTRQTTGFPTVPASNGGGVWRVHCGGTCGAARIAGPAVGPASGGRDLAGAGARPPVLVHWLLELSDPRAGHAGRTVAGAGKAGA